MIKSNKLYKKILLKLMNNNNKKMIIIINKNSFLFIMIMKIFQTIIKANKINKFNLEIIPCVQRIQI